MKKGFLLLWASCLAFTACQPGGTPVVSGTVTGGEGQMIYFEELDGTGIRPIDSAEVKKDGSFALYKKAGKTNFYRLRLGPEQTTFGFAPPSNILILITDSTETIEVQAQKDGFAKDYSVKGSEESILFLELVHMADSTHEELKNLGDRMRMADQDELLALSAESAELQQRLRERYRAWINKHRGKFVTLQAMSMIDPELNLDLLKEHAEVLSEKYSENIYVQRLNDRIRELDRQLRIGSKAPDFTLETPEGEIISLSSLLNRGKYVLVDFWASWYRPCRIENPHLVSVYERFKHKVEFFGVSLDGNAEAWKRAIQDDGLVWPQGSDLQAWNSEPARLYNVNTIPANFILSPQGEILAKNARGPELEQVLEQLARP